jgi:hypothetical protein
VNCLGRITQYRTIKCLTSVIRTWYYRLLCHSSQWSCLAEYYVLEIFCSDFDFDFGSDFVLVLVWRKSFRVLSDSLHKSKVFRVFLTSRLIPLLVHFFSLSRGYFLGDFCSQGKLLLYYSVFVFKFVRLLDRREFTKLALLEPFVFAFQPFLAFSVSSEVERYYIRL